MDKNRIEIKKIVIIGNGIRAHKLYIPLIKKLPFFELWGICGRDYTKTIQVAKNFNSKVSNPTIFPPAAFIIA